MRIRLTDKSVARLKPATDYRGYVVRDDKLACFVVRVGLRKKTYRYEGETRIGGKRVAISRKLGEHPYTPVEQARAAAHDIIGQRANGRLPTNPNKGVTLATAFEEYTKSLQSRQASTEWIRRSAAFYRRCLSHWGNETLKSLSGKPEMVRDWHTDVTTTRGPSEANHAARVLQSIYRRAQKTDRSLPAMHPCTAVLFNPERRANKAIPFEEFAGWAKEVALIPNPVRGAFHRMCVLTGMRPGELARLRWDGIDCRKRTMTVGKTKTGVEITIPISLAIAQELRRARDAGRVMHETKAREWVFPSANSERGYLATWTDKLSHQGNAGRHTYRTVAASIGIDELSIRLLQGHALTGVSQGYVTRQLLVGTSLRTAQRRISRRIVELMGDHKAEPMFVSSGTKGARLDALEMA